MKHLDLFSGIGGFALAAQWAGFETVQFVEIDPFARAVLAKNFPGVPVHGDIKTYSGESLRGTIDLLTGGFPCQPFSVAGQRRGTEDDRHLWPEMARVIAEARPRWVLGENVAGFIPMALDDCLADLESLGYEAWAVVVPACAVGAWHRRDRVWIIAHTDGEGLENGRPPRQQACPGETIRSVAQSEPERCGGTWRTSPSRICRVADGLSRRLDERRISALGNAVVPQCAYELIRAIKEIEDANRNQDAVGVARRKEGPRAPLVDGTGAWSQVAAY